VIIVNHLGKRKSFETIDVMMRKLKFDSIDDDQRERLLKAERNGDVTFISHNPKVSSLEHTRVPMIADDRDTLEEMFWTAAEEV
jgi:hypothetical protein